MKVMKDMKILGDRLRARHRAQLVFMPSMAFVVIVVGAALTAFTTHHVEG